MCAVFYLKKKHNAKEDQDSIFIKSLGSMQVILSHEKVQNLLKYVLEQALSSRVLSAMERD